jgi:hypothetical protein
VVKRRLAAVLAVLAAVAGGVAGLAYLGRAAADRVSDDPRFAVPVASIQCPAPPGMDLDAFLNEVRYLGRLPTTVSAVDPKLNEQLSAAFMVHPWVDQVGEIEVTAERQIRVQLEFRVPKLRVMDRMVDGTGVLLPRCEPLPGLPLLVGDWPEPDVPAGRVWPSLKRPAELAAEYRPAKIEKTDRGWRLLMLDGRTLTVSW